MVYTDYIYRRLHEGLTYRLRTFANGRYASHCRPVSVLILLTERCNAKCVHCDIWKNRGREDSPTVEQWKQTLADIRRWLGPVHVVFTGGEALLKPYAIELIGYAHQLGQPSLFQFCLHTRCIGGQRRLGMRIPQHIVQKSHPGDAIGHRVMDPGGDRLAPVFEWADEVECP